MKILISRLASAGDDIPLPAYATEHAAGMDVRAAVEGPLVIPPGETVCVPTGFAFALPPGFEAQVRARSGLAARHQIGVLNAPGTVDADYRGEVMVILTNFGREDFTVRRGDRIAQLVIARHEKVTWEPADVLPGSSRGAGGFGHTGR
ncbi:MAG: dUTP diphosphatase [Bacteroidota bacterium]